MYETSLRGRALRTAGGVALSAALLLSACGQTAPAPAPTAEPAQEAAAETQSVPAAQENAGETAPETSPALPPIDLEAAEYISRTNDIIRFAGGKLSERSIADEDAALEALYEILPALGGNENTELTFDSTLGLSSGMTCYNFVQTLGSLTVTDATVKLITNDDKLVGVVSGLQTVNPEEYTEPITAEQAEEIVMEQANGANISLAPEYTSQRLMPVDVLGQENKSLVTVWIVYTSNPDLSSERPWLASYVQANGTYLYSLPVHEPLSVESETGFDHSQFFEGFSPVDYTQTVTWQDGSTEELTIPIQKDEEGTLYLSDADRHIVMADYTAYALSENAEIAVLTGDEETGFPDRAVGVYNAFVKVYDYYKSMGWDGPDGKGTDTLLLYDYRDANGQPQPEAFYMGTRGEGWQRFAFNSIEDDGRSIDVVAHEFTHAVSLSAALYSPYVNDVGAINEAVSDIIGKLMEQQIRDVKLEQWIVGELGTKLRNMGNPHEYTQPEYVWDQYYIPNTYNPSSDNDNGGVHSNSSLLNLVAYKLCQAGMPLDEALDYWIDAVFCIGPATTYPELSVMLPWLMELNGYQYADALTEAIRDTGINSTEIGDRVPDGYARAVIDLPGKELFALPNVMVQFINRETEHKVITYPSVGSLLVSGLLEPGEYAVAIGTVQAEGQTISFGWVWTEDGWVDAAGSDVTPGFFTVKAGDVVNIDTKGLAELADNMVPPQQENAQAA